MNGFVERGWISLRVLALCAMLASLGGCGAGGGQAKQPAVAIVKGDTCVVCGMEIGPYPGPRAEAYVAGASKPLKFGGTRDFFAYVTQPDLVTRLDTLYVQDCAHIDWAHPIDAPESFVDARKAYYVGWQPLQGEMGPTFASFAKRADAEAFIRVQGGALLRYEQITPQMVSRLNYDCPAKGSPLAQLVGQCVQKEPVPAARAPAMPGMGGMGKPMAPPSGPAQESARG